jgi:FSR family fosmidomycin resistance protein-like MFS transporter
MAVAPAEDWRVFGWLADRSGRLRAVRAGYALALPGLAGLLVAPSPGLAAVAGAVLGLALFIPFSVQVTLAQEYLPARVGTASGLTVGLAVSVGGVLAPLLGVLADHAGRRAALAVLVLLPVAALAASTRLPEPDRRRRAPSHHR